MFHVTENDWRILGVTVDLEASEIVSLTNLKRQENGLPPLKQNEQLANAALAKANDMFQFGYWDHFSPSKRPPWSFILEAGYDYHYAGENLAKDFKSVPKLVDAWMASPPHKANLLSENYEDIGVAVVTGQMDGQDTVLIVQMFGKVFTPADFHLDQNHLKEYSTPLLESPSSPIGKLFGNEFLATKVLALSTVWILLVILGTDVFKNYKLTHLKKISRKHWGHLLFLLTIGTLVWLTAPRAIV